MLKGFTCNHPRPLQSPQVSRHTCLRAFWQQCPGRKSKRRQSPYRRAQIFALDAAMPFDFEHKATHALKKQRSLTIAILGFGTFGQFLAKRLIAAGHQVTASSRGDYSSLAKSLGVTFYPDVNDLCEAHPDIVVLASSILSTKEVLKTIPAQRLRRSTLFVDVLSVKLFPKQLMLAELPPEMDILCTHPMFGPDSGKASWKGLNMMFEKVRIGSSSARQSRVSTFLKFFEDEGCQMVEMSCEEHDKHAASTQFITHTVGRILGGMRPQSTPIDTKGYQSLLNLVDNTTHDSFDLYYGLFMYNPNATEELTRLEEAFNAVRQGIFTRLHDVVRDQIFVTEESRANSSPGNGQSLKGSESKESEASRSNGSPLSKAEALEVGHSS